LSHKYEIYISVRFCGAFAAYKKAFPREHIFQSKLSDMKKLSPVILLVVYTAQAFSQEVIKDEAHYLNRSKRQKSAAWSMVGLGSALIGVGFLIGNRDNSSFGEAAAGGLTGILGAGALISSVPLFIASGRNKRKAFSLSIKGEPVRSMLNSHLAYNTMPAISLRINISKNRH
jgi:uncharacterized membrane protein YfcA